MKAGLLQGSGRPVPSFGWHQTASGRRKNGREKLDINDVHYWMKVMPFREERSVWLLEKLFGESFSSGDEWIRSMRNEKGERVSEKDKVSEVSHRRNLHTLKNL